LLDIPQQYAGYSRVIFAFKIPEAGMFLPEPDIAFPVDDPHDPANRLVITPGK
jgi:hypothetical protein